MFRKIVSNLSLSPGAGSQLTYYLKRLQKEGITRKLSMVFAVGLIALQIATIVSPTHASNVPSENDIVWGGLGSDAKTSMLQIYDQNADSHGHTNYQDLYKYFGITRANIAASQLTTINSNDPTLHSLGRTHRFADDLDLVIDNVHYYYRPLADWGANIPYPALVGSRDDGSYFAVMVDCGNIVVKTIPVKPPKLTIAKTHIAGYPKNGETVEPGDTLGFQLNFSNIGAGEAHDALIEDPIPAHTHLKWQGGGMPQAGTSSTPIPFVADQGNGRHVWWKQPQMPTGFAGYTAYTVTVDDNTPDKTKICNTAYIRSDELAIIKSQPPLCVTVSVPPPNKPKPKPKPVPPTPTNPLLSQSKTVANVTKNISDAKNSTADAGDILKYSLITKNTGNGAQKGYTINEDLTDVLAYASVSDTGGGTLVGDHLTWPAATIGAGGTLTKVFQVKINNPVQTTANSLADPKLNDCQLDNAFVNSAVTVKINCPVPKQVETTVGQLPQTGSTSDSIVLFSVVAGMVFLYMRNRQLIHELKLLRVDNVTGQ